MPNYQAVLSGRFFIFNNKRFTFSARNLCNNIIVIIFVVSKNNRDTMRSKTKERKRHEKELLFYLDLYNELNGREGAAKTLEYLNEEIDKLVEILKQM